MRSGRRSPHERAQAPTKQVNCRTSHSRRQDLNPKCQKVKELIHSSLAI